ncbi:MAG: ANTAR domain-containing protein [Actinomycetota bacterium]|nr:ANTAR domain-containing protein [Actinomycetota bacterium]
MGQSQPEPVSTPHVRSACGRNLEQLARSMHHLVASAEPAVTFSSLARVCVPDFSDTCTVDLVEVGRAAYRIAYPADPSPPSPTGATTQLRTPIASTPGTPQPAYSGMIVHSWHQHRPDAADAALAQMLALRAITAIDHERLEEVARHAVDQVASLQAALMSNRQIGTALGILMTIHKITDTAAFALMRTASQHTHRKLRDIADDVVATGCLELRSR